MSENQNIEEGEEDSMEPGELKVTPPGTPVLNPVEISKENEDKKKNDGGNNITNENVKSLSSLDILKTYQDQEDDRFMSVSNTSGNTFFDRKFPAHPGKIMMPARGFPLFRGKNRGVSVKARLGFRGGHRGGYFQGRGRGFVRRNSRDIRDFKEVKSQFKMKLMYTKTKPSLSWHPNPKYSSPQKLEVFKNKSINPSKSAIDKKDDVGDEKFVRDNNSGKQSSKVRDKKKISSSLDRKKSKESKTKKKESKEKKESKKKRHINSKDRNKSEKKKDKDENERKTDRKVADKEKTTKKDLNESKSEKSSKKTIREEKSKERNSRSSDRSHVSKKKQTEEYKKLNRSKDRSKNSKTPERKKKTRSSNESSFKRSMKKASKLLDKKTKSPSANRKYSSSIERSTTKTLDDSKSKDKTVDQKANIEKENKLIKEKEYATNDNNEKHKIVSKKIDIFQENSPNTPEPLESTTPELTKLIYDIPSPTAKKSDSINENKNDNFSKNKKKKDKKKRNRTVNINPNSLSFSDELLVYEEELEHAFPLTKDGTIQAADEKTEKQNKTEKIKENKTDEIFNSSPDTEDYQDMWEDDDDLLPSSQLSENNRLENKLLNKNKIHDEILKNIKVEIEDEMEVIKRNQDVIENEIFKNLASSVEQIRIKQERISTDEQVVIKRERKSDESSSSSDESENDDDGTSSGSSSSDSSSSSSSGSTSSDSTSESDKSEKEFKDGFSTPLFVNPSPPPELALTLNVKDVVAPPIMHCQVSKNKIDRLSSTPKYIENSIEEIMAQSEKSFISKRDLKKSPDKENSPKNEVFDSPTIKSDNNMNYNNILSNSHKESNINKSKDQKFVIAMQDIYEQFLQSVTNAGVDLSCENVQKSPKSSIKNFKRENSIESEFSNLNNIEDISENKKEFMKTKSESVVTPEKKPESHIITKISPICIEIAKPKRIHNIIPLDEINVSHLTNVDLQNEVNNLKLSEIKSPKFDLAISPKVDQPTIVLAPEKLSSKLSEILYNESTTKSIESNSDDSTSSSTDSDDSDSDSDDTSSSSSDSDADNPRSILGVDVETLQSFSPEDRKNLRALEKRLNTLQGWSAVDEDDKEVFKGLKNILEREIELIIRKYIPLVEKPVTSVAPYSPPREFPKKEPPKEEKTNKQPISTIKHPTSFIPTIPSKHFERKNESETLVLSGNTFLPVPIPTIFSIGAEMAKNNAALQKMMSPLINEMSKSKDDSSKTSSKSSSSKSSKSEHDSKRRRSKSPSDRSHKSSSKRNTHSPSRKSPSKYSKDSKRDRSKSPHSREDRRKSSPYHKSSSSSSSRRNRESPNKKQLSSRHKHRRSSSVSRITPRHSRSPGSIQSKRFRVRTPTPPRSSKIRQHDKGTIKSGHGRKSDLHRSRSFSRSRSRSITARDSVSGFRGRGRIRGSISPIRRSFSPRRMSTSPRRSASIRRSASPRGGRFSRSPIPFRPPSPSVSPPPSGNDSSRSPKRHLRSLSRSRTRSRSLSPHMHKIRRLEISHHSHWAADENNGNNQYYAENTYGYATSPSRMTMTINSEPPRRIDTVIGSRVLGDDAMYQPYGQYSGYDYIQPTQSNMTMPNFPFDFNMSSNGTALYSNNENSEYYYHSDYQDNRNYLPMNQVETLDPKISNTIKTIAVQKGNVLEIVPSTLLPDDLDSSTSLTIETKENIKIIEKKDELKIEFDVKKEDTSFITQNVEQKKKKVSAWKREVNRRQMLAAVLKLNRDSDRNMKSILIKPEEKTKEKKRVLFADGIKPGSGPADEKSSVHKKEKKLKKEKKDKKKNKVAIENKENTNLMELLNIDSNISPELENAPPPPPPTGSPPPHLEQPIYIRPASPPDFTYFHFDGAVNCMYFSKNPVPIPPRLLNGSFPSPPRSNQQNQHQVQQSQLQNQVQIQHHMQLQVTQSSKPIQIHHQQIQHQSSAPLLQQQPLLNQNSANNSLAGNNGHLGNIASNQCNVLSSIAIVPERITNSILMPNRKISSPVPVISTNSFPGNTATCVRPTLIQRFHAASHFGPSNTSMSSCNFSIPPPNIPSSITPSQHNQTVSTGSAQSPLIPNRHFIQNIVTSGVKQQSPTLEQIKRATAALPFQPSIQANNSISIIAPVPAPILINSNSNSPAFSSDSSFWKNKDNTNSNSNLTTLSTSSSPLAVQSLSVQKMLRGEIKNSNLSPNTSPGQKKIIGKFTDAP